MTRISEKSQKHAVTWFEALNEQVEWSNHSLMLKWLADVFGFQLQPSEQCRDRFISSLRMMRLQIAAARFQRSLDLSWLDDELRTCSVRLNAEATAASRLPTFRADATGLRDSHTNSQADVCLEQLRLTLLMQFAEFIGDTIDSGINESPRIDRCRGLYRCESPLPEQASYPATMEMQWRNEIDLLHERETAAGVVRCEYFFPKTAKGRFCSDSCRFSTFQITKQLQEPNYLANKQKRYRSSKLQ